MKPRSNRHAPTPLPHRADFRTWHAYSAAVLRDVEQRVADAESGVAFEDAFDLFLRAVALAPGETLTLTTESR